MITRTFPVANPSLCAGCIVLRGQAQSSVSIEVQLKTITVLKTEDRTFELRKLLYIREKTCFRVANEIGEQLAI